MTLPQTDQIDAVLRDLTPEATAVVVDTLITNVHDALAGVPSSVIAELAVALSVAGLAHCRLMTKLDVGRDVKAAQAALDQIHREVHR